MKKVVCIWEEWEPVTRWGRLIQKLFGKNGPDPQKDHIYTVENESEGYYDLVEFTNDRYRTEGFRPIIEDQAEFEEVTFQQMQKPISVN